MNQKILAKNQGCVRLKICAKHFIYDPEGIYTKVLFYEACTQKMLTSQGSENVYKTLLLQETIWFNNKPSNVITW